MVTGRQTYQGRDYSNSGRSGRFKESEKILLRYDNRKDHNPNDRNIIRNWYNKAIDTVQKIGKVKKQVMQEALPIYLEALKKYTPVDTGNLRDGWKVSINPETGDLHWENDATRDGKSYLYAQNYGKEGVTPTGGTYWYAGYYFLEKAREETMDFIERRQNELINGVKSKKHSEGFS